MCSYRVKIAMLHGHEELKNYAMGGILKKEYI